MVGNVAGSHKILSLKAEKIIRVCNWFALDKMFCVWSNSENILRFKLNAHNKTKNRTDLVYVGTDKNYVYNDRIHILVIAMQDGKRVKYSYASHYYENGIKMHNRLFLFSKICAGNVFYQKRRKFRKHFELKKSI
jgi:hypothetical protein